MDEVLGPPLTPGQSAGFRSRERGLESERNIARALRAVPYVIDIFPTSGDDLHDPDGTDLIVFVDRPHVRVLYIQSKSRKKGEKNFIRKFGKRMRKRGIIDVPPSQGLIQDSRMVLNGQQSDSEIVQCFEAKLGPIELYRAEHSHP